jgi:ribosomal-protein-alanine N-acetyltransferase
MTSRPITEVSRITDFDTGLIEKLTAIETEAFEDGGLNRWSFPVVIRHGALYVLKCNGAICGIADIIKDWHDPHLAFIYNFVIKKDQRGKGLSGIFLDRLVVELAKERIFKVQLTVSANNEPALKSYSKAGFVKIDELKNEYGLQEDRLLLELDVRKGYGRRR